MLNQIKQESKVRVQNITADGNLKVTQLNQEKDQKLMQLRSEAQVSSGTEQSVMSTKVPSTKWPAAPAERTKAKP